MPRQRAVDLQGFGEPLPAPEILPRPAPPAPDPIDQAVRDERAIERGRREFLAWLDGLARQLYSAAPWQAACYVAKRDEALAVAAIVGEIAEGTAPLIEANALLDGETVRDHAARVLAEEAAFVRLAAVMDPARRAIEHGQFQDPAAFAAEAGARRAAVLAAIQREN